MKEFTRLAVGVLFLGLAIFLSVNFERPDQSASETPNATTDNITDAVPGKSEGDLQPNWQASPPPVDKLTQALTRSDANIVRPQFDNPATQVTAPRPAPSFEATQFQPPQISDRYQPMQPISVTGQLNRTSSLVPVQPKPSFTGTISYVQQLHTVRQGDSLQSLAREYYGTADRYLDIYIANKDVLSNPARIPEGVELRIPGQ